MKQLNNDVMDYIDSRLGDIKALMTEPCESLLPAERALGELAQFLNDVDLDALTWEQVEAFCNFGADDQCWWLRKKVTLPRSRSDRQLGLRFDVGPMVGVGHGALLYVNGREYEAFTPRMEGVFEGHVLSILPNDLPWGQTCEFVLKFYAGRDHGPMGPAQAKRLETFELVWFDSTAARLYYRGITIRRLLETLDASEGTYQKLTELLKSSLLMVDFSSARHTHKTLGRALKALEQGLKDRSGDSDDLLTLVGVGHAHIDVAWTWPYRVTREKTVQTFATAVGLIDRYDEYVFQQGQPQLYVYVKENAPDLYARVQAAVAGGRWDADGGMWVEPDCNIPSGESLVRQLIYGRRFFREALGVDSKVLWLPDTFGFPQTLPQIARGCNIAFFVTTKISWNRYNRFPYTFFHWQAPDGTTLPTYFMSMPWYDSRIDTYNAMPDPISIVDGWRRRCPKESNRTLLNSIGWGDGGGGATFEAVEWMRALDGIGGRLAGRWQKVYEFLKGQYDTCENELPTWRDELFLEFHRGTLTTHADLKKLNRRAEVALGSAEMIAALADPTSYPAQRFRALWQEVLLNQFHDVLAGSSARDVFEEARDIYQKAIGGGREIQDAASDTLFGSGNDTRVVFNALGHERTGLIEVELPAGKTLASDQGEQLAAQRLSGATCLVDVGSIPPVGYRRFRVVDNRETIEAPDAVMVEKHTLENTFLRVVFDPASGFIASVFDKIAGREVLTGMGNVLQLFEDKPFEKASSGWDIDRIYEDKSYPDRVKLAAFTSFGGPLRGGVVAEWQLMESTLRQEITLDHDRAVITFKTWVDWQEREILLKTAFPVAVNASQACFDIQYGHIHRPTHRNTLWDIAKYEVPCQKWIDLSEGDYGVSVLNDSKYGCDVRDNVMRLTLLRSTINPDPIADRGFHEFTYALYPHAGPWWQAETVPYAKELNVAPIVRPAADGPAEHCFVRLEPGNLVLEAVKGCEDGRGIVVRFYETANTRGQGQIAVDLPFEPKRAAVCDMEENEIKPLAIENNAVRFDYGPCQILTVVFTA